MSWNWKRQTSRNGFGGTVSTLFREGFSNRYGSDGNGPPLIFCQASNLGAERLLGVNKEFPLGVRSKSIDIGLAPAPLDFDPAEVPHSPRLDCARLLPAGSVRLIAAQGEQLVVQIPPRHCKRVAGGPRPIRNRDH